MANITDEAGETIWDQSLDPITDGVGESIATMLVMRFTASQPRMTVTAAVPGMTATAAQPRMTVTVV